jgi:hypothetical protein
LTGYSYIQAAALYAEASHSAFRFPELAKGMSPLDGIMVPTFGSLYLIVTFLFPFVAIRSLGAEKQSGALKLLVQLPYPVPILLLAKLAAISFAWLALLFPCLLALGFWAGAGGHLDSTEVANLILGHFLYALIIAAISLFAAALAESASSAALAAVGANFAFWILDFSATGNDGLLKSLSGLSLTAVLRSFERGIFSMPAVLGSCAAALGIFSLAGTWLHPAGSPRTRLAWAATILVLTALGLLASDQAPLFVDASEDRRNSFSRAEESGLKQASGRLEIEVFLAREDPRLYDLELSILGKLRRAMPDVEVIYTGEKFAGALAGGEDLYGQVVYRYKGQERWSRSSSEEEVLPLVFEVMGLSLPVKEEASDYPGYPLLVQTAWPKISFFGLLPLSVSLLWLTIQHPRENKRKIYGATECNK